MKELGDFLKANKRPMALIVCLLLLGLLGFWGASHVAETSSTIQQLTDRQAELEGHAKECNDVLVVCVGWQARVRVELDYMAEKIYAVQTQLKRNNECLAR